jgi:Domain of unknown function (DUF397)
MISASSLPGAVWRKSSYSGSNGGDCLEVAHNARFTAPVRDSKRPDGPALILGLPAWNTFVAAVRTNTLAP